MRNAALVHCSAVGNVTHVPMERIAVAQANDARSPRGIVGAKALQKLRTYKLYIVLREGANRQVVVKELYIFQAHPTKGLTARGHLHDLAIAQVETVPCSSAPLSAFVVKSPGQDKAR